MFCNKCGASLPDGAQFCGNCGNRIANRPAVQMPDQNSPANVPNTLAAMPSPAVVMPNAGAGVQVAASKGKFTASKIILFASAVCTVALLVLSLISFGSSIGMLCDELASYQKNEAMLLALACGISMGVFAIFLACAASVLVTRFFTSKGQSPKGSPLAITFLVLALILAVAAVVSGIVFPNSAASGLGAACYLISAAFAGMQPAAIILCLAAVVTAVLYARASKKGAR